MSLSDTTWVQAHDAGWAPMVNLSWASKHFARLLGRLHRRYFVDGVKELARRQYHYFCSGPALVAIGGVSTRAPWRLSLLADGLEWLLKAKRERWNEVKPDSPFWREVEEHVEICRLRDPPGWLGPPGFEPEGSGLTYINSSHYTRRIRERVEASEARFLTTWLF